MYSQNLNTELPWSLFVLYLSVLQNRIYQFWALFEHSSFKTSLALPILGQDNFRSYRMNDSRALAAGMHEEGLHIE